MNTCTMCGVTIPEGQKVCSICYGDPFYGTDGLLLAAIQAEEERAYLQVQQTVEEDNGKDS